MNNISVARAIGMSITNTALIETLAEEKGVRGLLRAVWRYCEDKQLEYHLPNLTEDQEERAEAWGRAKKIIMDAAAELEFETLIPIGGLNV